MQAGEVRPGMNTRAGRLRRINPAAPCLWAGFQPGSAHQEVLMVSGKKIFRFFIWLGVALLQVFMTQLVTFMVSLPFPRGMEDYPQTQPVLFVFIVGLTFTAGVFFTGWLAIQKGWIAAQPKTRARLIGTLLGAYLPLIVSLLLYYPKEAQNPFFIISIFTCLAGFYLPGWSVVSG
jgi:hypothetical protein